MWMVTPYIMYWDCNPSAQEKTAAKSDKDRKVAASQRIAQWKWLIIEKISMVSANFLAELDMHLRQIMTDVSLMKKDMHRVDQAFGGINILFVGDFHQLDPPTGTPINGIPASFIQKAREYAPGATDEHGEYLFWGSGPGTVHGVSELTICERHDNADEWLLEVQEEFRENKLSADNHAFLHGEPTNVPGSYVNGQLTCNNDACKTLLSKKTHDNAKRILKEECVDCQNERKRRQLVVKDATDERLKEQRFLDAPAIFPNNDIKYDVNKKRAEHWCQYQGLPVTWSLAQDTPKHAEFQSRPYLQRDKEKWIHYHDKHCEKLYGMLPLAVGLPVMLVDHLDRNPAKQLLRGKEGHIHSWVNDPDERSTYDVNADARLLSHVPLCVFVDFHTESWHLPGAPGPGIYPVFQTERTWFLDGYRGKKAVLAIRRKQIPLAPGLACTAHSAQGKTKEAVIADLALGRGVSGIASYVAITRVKNREGLMIYRPFDIAPFKEGIPEGTALLLRKLRGEELDWAMIEERLILKKACTVCKMKGDKSKFTRSEFRKTQPCRCALHAWKVSKENWMSGHIISVKRVKV